MCIKCVAVSLHVCSFMRFCIRNVRISSTLSGCASQVRPILGAGQIWKISPPKKKPPWNFLGWKISTPRCSWWVREKSVTVSPKFLHGPYKWCMLFFIEGPADPAQALTGLAEATVVPLFFQQAPQRHGATLHEFLWGRDFVVWEWSADDWMIHGQNERCNSFLCDAYVSWIPFWESYCSTIGPHLFSLASIILSVWRFLILESQKDTCGELVKPSRPLGNGG